MMKRIVTSLITLYKYTLSPLLPPACRFYPSCSTYAQEAVQRYGVSKGLWLAMKRLLRCQPFCPGGYDPVP